MRWGYVFALFVFFLFNVSAVNETYGVNDTLVINLSEEINTTLSNESVDVVFNNLKEIWYNHLKISQIETYQQKMYQQSSFAKKSEVNKFVEKYGIHIYIEEYKLNKQQKIKKVEEYLNESNSTTFNSYQHHKIINKMINECIEIIVK